MEHKDRRIRKEKKSKSKAREEGKEKPKNLGEGSFNRLRQKKGKESNSQEPRRGHKKDCEIKLSNTRTR